MKKYFIAFAGLLLLSSATCNKKDKSTGNSAPVDIAFEVLLEGEGFNLRSEIDYFELRSAQDLALLSDDFHEGFLEINFQENNVLGLAVEVPSAGFNLSIEKVMQKNDGTVQVSWRMKPPPADAMVAMVIVQHYIFIKIPKLDPKQKVEFLQQDT